MSTFFRPSSVIERQIAEFRAALPHNVGSPPPGDFAATMQWDAWQHHLQSLEAELEAAINYELLGADVTLALDGDPVQGHAVQAGFLSTILGKAQALVLALAQAMEQRPTGRGTVPNRLVSEYRLMLSGVFDSSFGMKLRFPIADELDHLQLGQPEKVLDQFCKLLDPELEQRELLDILAAPRVKSHYLALIKALGKDGATVLARTPRIRHGIRLTASQARDRDDWLNSFVVEVQPLELEGILAGGSISRNRFELQVGDDTYSGSVSAHAKGQMLGVRFGARVRATIEETTSFVEEGAFEGATTHYLRSIELLSE